jgi:homoserine O-acetyltransferase
MMAHITYVSAQSLDTKFGHRRRTRGDDWTLEPDFEVEQYLQHQGDVFLGRFDALSYLYLTRLLDYFDPFGDSWTADRLRSARTRFQLTSFDSDWRFDTAQTRDLAQRLGDLGLEIDVAEIASPYGHDSFLLEPPGYHDRIRAFLDH